jgi:ribosomal protein S18 acetylase RimI-like enzyme
MVETVTLDQPAAVAAAARLLHDFNVEYDDPAPPPEVLAARLSQLLPAGDLTVLLARDPEGTPVGVAVLRSSPSIWSEANETYVAELYVVPGRRGQGFGRELITATTDAARAGGADYAFLVTSEDDTRAQRLYEAAGFRRTEGEGGPLMLAYERDL